MISTEQMCFLAFVAVWIVSGLVLAVAIMWKDGIPDRDGWDGPEIDWGGTFDLIRTCVIGGPLWFVLLIWLKAAA